LLLTALKRALPAPKDSGTISKFVLTAGHSSFYQDNSKAPGMLMTLLFADENYQRVGNAKK
jgi:hypothetical protein